MLELMELDEIIGYVDGLDGTLTLRPAPGDGSPEISWGDVFFYYAPDGVVPQRTQPFATIVTKNYPGDEASRLDSPGAFRVNMAVGKEVFNAAAPTGDPAEPDTVIAHPVYGAAAWLAVVNPGPRTENTVRELLRTAYDRARQCNRRPTTPTPRRRGPSLKKTGAAG